MGGCEFLAPTNAATVDTRRILFPAAYVLSGDTIFYRGTLDGTLWTDSPSSITDADKDDYVQNCVGGPDEWNPGKRMAHSQPRPKYPV